MQEVGDYEWCQLSMWDFAPKPCIEKFVRSQCGHHLFHYYLRQVVEVVSDTHRKVKTVETLDGVPEDVLNWRNDNYKLKI